MEDEIIRVQLEAQKYFDKIQELQNEVKHYHTKLIIAKGRQKVLEERINKAIHRIQLLQMDGEVSVKDLTKLASILTGDDKE